LPEPAKSKRVYLLANPDKRDAASALADLEAFAAQRSTVVGAQVNLDAASAVKAKADIIVLLGGDGTLIGVARSLGQNQIPLVGINVGKLGFLTEFSVEEFKKCFDQALTDPALISRRGILEATLRRDEGTLSTSLAVNDCVIQAGVPFRPITLEISVNDAHLTGVRGDGLIICTPSGSTGHNLSAGGPIVQPGVDAIVITPLTPHSLTHRPLVVERDSLIDVRAGAVNEGTTAIIDGQVSFPLKPDDRLVIRRFHAECSIVRNPLYTKWHNLVTKLHWGRSPNYE
jgi:NAD+ kinase